jgi:epoxyqueuosine reductase QueG
MLKSQRSITFWLSLWMKKQGIFLWGAADLHGFIVPKDENGNRFPIGISFAVPMSPTIMISIRNGPNKAYADEYTRVNDLINTLSRDLTVEINSQGHQALALAASARTDQVNIKGDFPHKTAATRAGIGWIGRHCQIITRTFGSWVRLGTVFTDLPAPCGQPLQRNFCGNCMRCIEACPANALSGKAWKPGVSREEILNAQVCDRWKKEHYFRFHNGHNCGICSAVCPYGLKYFNKTTSSVGNLPY